MGTPDGGQTRRITMSGTAFSADAPVERERLGFATEYPSPGVYPYPLQMADNMVIGSGETAYSVRDKQLGVLFQNCFPILG